MLNKGHFKEQPSLEDIAEQANLSPYHFQRLFSEWVGTSPKVFGYEMHTNITPNLEKVPLDSLGVDAQFFDNDFNGPEHEYPYASKDLFKLQDIFDSVVN